MEEKTKIYPYLSPSDIIIRIAACVKTYKFKTFVKIESYSICIT